MRRNRKYIIWMAWRGLVSRKRRRGPTFMTVVSILGVAIGVAALIVVLSVMGGFENDIKNKLLRGEPQIEVVSSAAGLGFSLDEYPIDMWKSKLPHAKHVEPYTQAEVILKHGKHMAPGILFGIDPNLPSHLFAFEGTMIEGELNELAKSQKPIYSDTPTREMPGIVLGHDLSIQLGSLSIGETVTVISPDTSLGTVLAGGSQTQEFVVSGKFQSNMFTYDQKWAVVSLDNGRKFLPEYDPFLDEKHYVTGVGAELDDPFAVDLAAKNIGPLDGLKVLTWKERNSSLLAALTLEKFAMGSVLTLVLVVAAFSISGTMMMTVFHRKGEVSLLRALGMSRKEIARLFLMHGFVIGTVGIALGLGIGLGLCSLLRYFHILPLPAGVYYLRFMPVKFLPFDYAVICGLAWIFSLIASTYPAYTAARQPPSLGLRGM